MWFESKAVTCYGIPGNEAFRTIVTVAAQWNEKGQIRLIQTNEFASKGNTVDSKLSWEGRVFYQPSEPTTGKYFAEVFNLIAHSPAGYGAQQTKEQFFPPIA